MRRRLHAHNMNADALVRASPEADAARNRDIGKGECDKRPLEKRGGANGRVHEDEPGNEICQAGQVTQDYRRTGHEPTECDAGRLRQIRHGGIRSRIREPTEHALAIRDRNRGTPAEGGDRRDQLPGRVQLERLVLLDDSQLRRQVAPGHSARGGLVDLPRDDDALGYLPGAEKMFDLVGRLNWRRHESRNNTEYASKQHQHAFRLQASAPLRHRVPARHGLRREPSSSLAVHGSAHQQGRGCADRDEPGSTSTDGPLTKGTTPL